MELLGRDRSDFMRGWKRLDYPTSLERRTTLSTTAPRSSKLPGMLPWQRKLNGLLKVIQGILTTHVGFTVTSIILSFHNQSVCNTPVSFASWKKWFIIGSFICHDVGLQHICQRAPGLKLGYTLEIGWCEIWRYSSHLELCLWFTKRLIGIKST